jgi:hypothetical protein
MKLHTAQKRTAPQPLVHTHINNALQLGSDLILQLTRSYKSRLACVKPNFGGNFLLTIQPVWTFFALNPLLQFSAVLTTPWH